MCNVKPIRTEEEYEEALAGEREMTLGMAETLHKHLRLPVAELLRVANIPTPPGVVPRLSSVARVAAVNAD